MKTCRQKAKDTVNKNRTQNPNNTPAMTYIGILLVVIFVALMILI